MAVDAEQVDVNDQCSLWSRLWNGKAPFLWLNFLFVDFPILFQFSINIPVAQTVDRKLDSYWVSVVCSPIYCRSNQKAGIDWHPISAGQ